MITRIGTWVGTVASVAIALSGCGSGGTDAAPNAEGGATASSTAATTTTASSTPSPAPRLGSAELQSRWWTWAASVPEESNPVADLTGAHCAEHQASDVWFFAGTFGGTARRTCSVPAGVPLAGPVLNFTAQDAEGCDQMLATAQGEATVDGEPVRHDRLDPVSIAFDAVEGNPVTNGAGSFEGYGCGLWLWIPPLSAGEHELTVRGSSGGFSLDVTYQLTVAGT
ncbi:MAG TPA: hypothetical protein VIR27_13150 [Mycobacteriales bacterium]